MPLTLWMFALCHVQCQHKRLFFTEFKQSETLWFCQGLERDLAHPESPRSTMAAMESVNTSPLTAGQELGHLDEGVVRWQRALQRAVKCLFRMHI